MLLICSGILGFQCFLGVCAIACRWKEQRSEKSTGEGSTNALFAIVLLIAMLPAAVLATWMFDYGFGLRCLIDGRMYCWTLAAELASALLIAAWMVVGRASPSTSPLVALQVVNVASTGLVLLLVCVVALYGSSDV